MNKENMVIEISLKTLYSVLLVGASIWLAITIKDVLFALLLAFILAMAIAPLVDKLQKRKVPRTISILGVILVLVGLTYLIISLVVPPFVNEITVLFENRNEYTATIMSYLQNLSPSLRDNLTNILNNSLNSFGNLNLSGVVSGAQSFFSGILSVVLVVILCFYMLQSKNGVEGIITAYLPKQHQQRVLSIFRKISSKMGQWLRGQMLLCFIIFAINLIGLTIFKVDYALTLAILSGFLELLPIIGPVVAGGLAVLVALTQSPLLALIVFSWYVIIQQLENHVLVPQVMKKSLGLNPIAVILAIYIGGKLLGMIGILVAVPIAAVVNVLLDEFVRKQEDCK